MRPRFQADNDLRSAIRTGLLRREPAIDFKCAKNAGLDGVPDPDVLLRADEDGRILVSHDASTMPAQFRSFLASGRHSSGLIIVPQQVSTGASIESLLLVWIAKEAEEWRDRLDWLPY